MHDEQFESAGGRLKWARLQAGYAEASDFAQVVRVHPTTYRAYENDQNGYSKRAADFAAKLGVPIEWLLRGGPVPTISRREVAAPAPDIAPTISDDASASIIRIDLNFSMGPGTNLDDHIEDGTFDFDINYLRSLTPTPAYRLRIGGSDGDSMIPTIMPGDLVIFDLNQNQLNMQDRIYACSVYGAGAVKRLRRVGKGKVEVISDNPTHGNQIVDEEDLRIFGRVVGSIRRH